MNFIRNIFYVYINPYIHILLFYICLLMRRGWRYSEATIDICQDYGSSGEINSQINTLIPQRQSVLKDKDVISFSRERPSEDTKGRED